MIKAIVVVLLVYIILAQTPLEERIYKNFKGNPCVLLLNRDGQYGCRSPRNGIVGPLHLVLDESELKAFISSPTAESQILVMPSKLLGVIDVIGDLQKTDKVLGIILMESGAPLRFSPDRQIKDSGGFAWNPYGNALFYQAMPFPLWLLGIEDSEEILEKAQENKNSNRQYPLNSAEITVFMHPDTKENSEICLRRGTCNPLGGQSIWTSISPLVSNKEIIFAMASIDSKSLFQYKTIGADSSVSGTVALMAALDAIISNKINVSLWKRQPVFAWFNGESFGNLGSTKFLHDINNYNQCIKKEGAPASCNSGVDQPYMKISLDKITAILELKQVGVLEGNGFYVHTNDHKMDRLTARSVFEAGLATGANVSQAATNTPGIPPSSLSSFLLQNSSFDQIGVVITDHQSEYENKFFESIFDGPDNVDSNRVCKAASLLASSLFILGTDISPGNPDYTTINANCTLVSTLLDCLTRNNSCSEMTSLLPPGMIDPSQQEFPIHYVGVYQPNVRYPYQKFLHDWIYERTANNWTGPECSTQCETGSCIRGICRDAQTFEHVAVSKNLEVVSTDFTAYWKVINPNDPDPIWTEADWTPIGLRTFKVSDPAYDYVFLVFAIIEAIVTAGIVFIFKKKFDLWFRIARS